MHLKKNSLILLIFISAIISGCNRQAAKTPAAPRVATAPVKQNDVPIYIDAIGQVISPVTVNIRPQVNGKLIKAYIEQGSLVKEGDVLYEIDPRPYQAILAEAKAQLARDEALYEYAQQAVNRYKSVVEEDFISKLTYEQYVSNAKSAQAQVELSQATVDAAQINVDYCSIVAPVTGKISFFNVDVGNILVIDDPNQITVIRPSSPIDVTFALPQQQFELIRYEQGNAGNWKFIATLPENLQRPMHGTTYFIDNQIDQNTGTILLKGRLENKELELWPGEFIRVKVLHKIARNALIVPPGTVLIGNNGPYVYFIDQNGKAATENVKFLTKTDEYTAIQSDKLKAGDTVIYDGQINIAPGTAVTEVPITKP